VLSKETACGPAFRRPNDTLAKLQAAPHTNGDAARPLPRLTDQSFTCTPASRTTSDAAGPLPRPTMHSEEANCNGRDAVAPKVTEELQLRSI